MKSLKPFLKKSFIGMIGLMTLFVAFLFWFFTTKEAPILKGEVIHHLNYKNELTLDLYLPTQKVYTKSPVILFIHGGAWIGGRKEMLNFNRFHAAINELREKGYTVISPNYTLAASEKSPFPACIEDAIDALEWIKENAQKYHLDLENIGIFGESAGAHIAMMTALAQGNGFEDTGIKLQYIVDIYGPNNLETLYQMPLVDSVNQLFDYLPESCDFDFTKPLFGFNPKSDSLKTKAFIHKFSPINYIDKNSMPILMIHGKNDRLVPISQSIALAQKLDSLNLRNEIHILDSVDHSFLGISEQQRADVQKWVVKFIERHYQK